MGEQIAVNEMELRESLLRGLFADAESHADLIPSGAVVPRMCDDIGEDVFKGVDEVDGARYGRHPVGAVEGVVKVAVEALPLRSHESSVVDVSRAVDGPGSET